MDDFFESEDYYGDEDGGGMEAEMKAFERVSAGNPFRDLMSASIDAEKRRGKPTLPTDKFYLKAYQMTNKINEESDIKITQEDMRIMAEKSQTIKDLQYKNPTAYILGYIVSRGGSRIDKGRFDNIVEGVLPLVAEEGGIEAPDILRYARYWVEFL